MVGLINTERVMNSDWRCGTVGYSCGGQSVNVINPTAYMQITILNRPMAQSSRNVYIGLQVVS